jgi:hypothetical protein
MKLYQRLLTVIITGLLVTGLSACEKEEEVIDGDNGGSMEEKMEKE